MTPHKPFTRHNSHSNSEAGSLGTSFVMYEKIFMVMLPAKMENNEKTRITTEAEVFFNLLIEMNP